MKTKIFYQSFDYSNGIKNRRLVDVDEKINKFIAENSIEIIDIKIVATSTDEDMDVIALVMYREVS
ncbi:hypothetical protein BK731_16860 [Bacillus thuringiensis serovar muju]|nr:hypothetical protein [Bacillus thuringiensis]MBH0346375.1 hypothetical protein [Bacillus thuringiensis]OTY05329.1 hypothetical protein BK731_16860 [Bacillus thuringiensis serovar muju]